MTIPEPPPFFLVLLFLLPAICVNVACGFWPGMAVLFGLFAVWGIAAAITDKRC